MTTNTLHNIAGSITAGCFSTILGHPLDTVKVHQQTSAHKFTNPSSLHVAKELCQGNALRLFKGIGPPMANQIIMNSVMFSVFHKLKDVTSQSGMDEKSASLCSGLLSGFATACLSTPFDWFKIQAQLSLTNKQVSRGSITATTEVTAKTDVLSICKHLWHDNNHRMTKVIQTIYRGHVPNLAREGVFTMVYLGTYDLISNAVRAKRYQQTNQQKYLPMHDVIMISSFTGACAWICNYPFDTIKSVMQSSKKKQGTESNLSTIGSTIQAIYKSGGVTSFFRGMGPSTLRAMLVTSARMLAYEKTLQILGD
ncbi:hypothetical protein ACHAWT_004483 [Skeletonema menzelii]